MAAISWWHSSFLVCKCGFFAGNIQRNRSSIVFLRRRYIGYYAQHKRGSAVVKGLSLHGNNSCAIALSDAEGGLEVFTMPLGRLQLGKYIFPSTGVIHQVHHLPQADAACRREAEQLGRG